MATTEFEVIIEEKVAAYRKKLEAMMGAERTRDEERKALNASCGWLYLNAIENKTSHEVKFRNPYNYDSEGSINPGVTKSSGCEGYIPLWSNSERYKITYYNKAIGDWKTITLKDLDHDWLLSVEHPGLDEDIRYVPRCIVSGEFKFIVLDNGYEIYSVDAGCVNGGVTWQPI